MAATQPTVGYRLYLNGHDDDTIDVVALPALEAITVDIPEIDGGLSLSPEEAEALAQVLILAAKDYRGER